MHRTSKAALLLAPLLAFVPLAPALAVSSTLVRLGTDTEGAVTRVAAATVNDERMVTVSTDSSSNLQVTAFDVTADGKFTKRGSASAGQTAAFAVAGLSMPSLALGATNVVTAVKAQNGTLELIDWFVDAGGSVLREGSIAAGPITQLAVAPVGSGRVVTLTQDSTGSTKLIAWDVSVTGQFTRRGDVTVGTGNGVVKVTAVSATQVVTAIRTTAGALQVNTFSLTQAGTLAATGQALGPAITDTSIVNTATDRAVTASRLANGNLEVSAWDVDPTGKVALASSSDAGAVDEIALGALGSAKVATAVRQADKTLKVIVWDVVSAVTRLQSNQAGAVGPIAVATLGYDRAVTPVQNGTGQLELIDWADFSLGMLRNAWSGPGTTDCTLSAQAPSHASKAGRANVAGSAAEPDDEEDEDFDRPEGEKGYTGGISQLWPQVVLDNAGSAPGTDQPSPSAAVVAQPDIQGVDPSIAAGQQYVIATEDHWIEFFDRSGHRLSSKAGEPTCLSAYKFFSGFLAPKNPNGTANRNNINRHLRSPLTYNSAQSCDPNTGAQTPCINEFYDTRVAYDPTIHRFIILSAVRHPISQDGINDLIVRRFFAFAISRSEDPRDGFDTYISTENNYSDWPRIATAPGQLVVAHWACKNPDKDDPCGSGDHRTTPLDSIALRPEAYILNLSDLVKKAAVIRNWKLYPYQTDGSSILPVAHRGTTSGYTILAHYRVPEGNNGIELFRFKQPTKWNAIPKLQKADGDIPGGAFTGYSESLTLLNGQLYYAGALQTAGRVANTTPAQYVVRGLRLAVTQLTNGTFAVASCPGSGCLQFSFGLHDGNDPAGALWSYELPSMAVNAAGDMVVVHGRVPIVNLPASVGQEARYRVFYPDNRGLQDGTLLRGGNTVLKLVGCNDTKPVTANYFHTCVPGPFQDFATAAADPDGQSIWVAHAFADKTLGSFKFVIGKVKP